MYFSGTEIVFRGTVPKRAKHKLKTKLKKERKQAMLVKSNDYAPSYVNYLNRLFGKDFWGNVWENRDVMTMPSANIAEDEKHFFIEIAAPGYRKEDFRVQLAEKDVLSISAETKTEESKDERHFTSREHRYATFERNFNLPDNVDIEHIEAKYENGLLKVILPKKAEEAPVCRLIAIG